MSFRYEQGPVVTILVSKSAGRYRVQSDSFEAMWLIVQVWSAASNLTSHPLLLCMECLEQTALSSSNVALCLRSGLQASFVTLHLVFSNKQTLSVHEHDALSVHVHVRPSNGPQRL